MEKTLLIVWHSRTGAAQQMAQAACQGAREITTEFDSNASLHIKLKAARDATANDVLAADGYVFCAPENLAALSGEMKEFFDRTYYAVLDRLNGRPYVLLVSAGSDGQGAAQQAQRICTGWRLRLVSPYLIVNTDAQTPEAILAPKQISAQDIAASREQGATLAALLLL